MRILRVGCRSGKKGTVQTAVNSAAFPTFALNTACVIQKVLFAVLGSLALAAGIIGLFVPGWPTTPFVLLAAWLYLKSSRRLHDWLRSHPRFGAILRQWEETRGMTRKAKIVSLLLMWTMIGLSVGFFIDSPTLDMVVLALGLTGTLVMVFFIRTVGS